MSKIAINVALLLPSDIEDFCIKINKESRPKRPLGKKDFRPHITLAMGLVEKENIDKVKESIKSLNLKSVKVLITKIKFRTTDQGERSSLGIKHTSHLQKMHEEVLGCIGPYLVTGVCADHLYKGNETGMSPITKLWLETYSEKTEYVPHITLQCYDSDPATDLPQEFIANKVGLFQVGDGCTCRNLLGLYELN